MKSTDPNNPIKSEIFSRIQEKLLDRDILSALPSSVIITDSEGHLFFWNHFLDIWLVQDTIEAGTCIDAVLESCKNPPLAQPNEYLNIVLDEIDRQGETCGFFSLVNGAQTQYHVKTINLNRLVWTFTDVSVMKRSEEFAQFYLDLMGHDIRNRLQEIMLFIEILAANPDISDFREILSHMSSAIEKCGNLIQKVKTTDGLDMVDMEEYPLSLVVAGVVEKLTGRFRDALIELQIDNSSCAIRADKFLPVLVQNIIENGIIHNSANHRRVWVRVEEAPWGYELCVMDNGQGIEDRRKRDLFDKQRRYGGVGLHITSMIVAKYGGHISIHDRIQNSPSNGAMVKVWFPSKDISDSDFKM
ncbi:MAG: sensor histidine kinase [Candidatus Thorarchaeota archaeon]